jgi:serine phosphatase RsbU (regulator of sigma subunit)
VAAALLMARLSAEVRFCLALETSPAAAVDKINSTFCRSGWEDRFVTFVLAVVDSTRHELVVVNAGHMPPLVRAASGAVESVGDDQAGLPLGVVPDMHYETSTRRIEPGDAVLMFTDGISEAMNPARQTYGLERLRQVVAKAGPGAPTCGRAVLDDVRQFTSGQVQSDDICLVCFGRI